MRPSRKLYRNFAFSLVLLASSNFAFSQTAQAPHPGRALIRKIELPLQEWLSQGERADIPWRVSVSKPVLTYQLQNLVRVTAEIDDNILLKQGIQHDLHFIVKVAPDPGSWDYGESYSHLRVEEALDPRGELQMMADFYVQPGVYTIATIVYDATSGKRSLFFNRIQVAAPGKDPLPELLYGLPKIQFLPPPDKAAPLGAGGLSLPVTTQRQVLLDLIVDLSTGEEQEHQNLYGPLYPDPIRRPIPGQWPDAASTRASMEEASAAQEIYAQSQLLQIASVLGALDLKQGCIQITALDVLRRHIVLPRTSANEVNWGKLRDQLLSPDKVMVSVEDLKGKQQAGRFFHEEVEQTMAQQQPPLCKLASATTVHMIAVLSRGTSFPSGSAKPQIQPSCNCKIFYLRQTGNGHSGDDLKNMLKPLSPAQFQFGNPQDFRKELLEFTQAIEKLS
ncbi:MAG TPA: hypothetical protein VFA71_07050 [Terriglobales bacterium]|nr:hypothetical protein [Terriglobales bacterium]